MTAIVWNSQWNTGITLIDNDHQGLVAVLNDLQEAVAAKSQAHLDKVMTTLIEYTQNHFSREEQLMDRHHYWGASGQKSQHREFVGKLNDLRTRMTSSDDQKIAIETMNFLRGWLINHILQEDKPLGGYLKEKGER